MAYWENSGESNEWYTPRRIFNATDCFFDLDAAAPVDRTHCCVPADHFITSRSLEVPWYGFTWLNPPFGKRGDKIDWVAKMAAHGNGVMLLPDRSSTSWWQSAAAWSSAQLFVEGKIKFVNHLGRVGNSPSVGTTLFAFGGRGVDALLRAEKNKLGIVLKKYL
jgi:hypothetical protein